MQDRWVSYIYRYGNEKRWENAGYIKVIRTSSEGLEKLRLNIGIRLCKPIMCRCKIYMIYGERELILLEELLVPPEAKEDICIKKDYPWKDFLREGHTPRDYDGVLFVINDGDTLMSLWKDKDIKISQLTVVNKKTKAEELAENPVEEKKEIINKKWDEEKPEANIDKSQEEEKKVVKNLEVDSIEQLMAESIKLPLFIDSPFSQCVKIVPQDIGRLPMSNWKLGQNSFLAHGYYRYKYIMLGKIKLANRESCVIGIPGVYTNKEKYLANMFGFSLFVPVKKSDTKMGSFGYWVWEVTKQ